MRLEDGRATDCPQVSVLARNTRAKSFTDATDPYGHRREWRRVVFSGLSSRRSPAFLHRIEPDSRLSIRPARRHRPYLSHARTDKSDKSDKYVQPIGQTTCLVEPGGPQRFPLPARHPTGPPPTVRALHSCNAHAAYTNPTRQRGEIAPA